MFLVADSVSPAVPCCVVYFSHKIQLRRWIVISSPLDFFNDRLFLNLKIFKLFDKFIMVNLVVSVRIIRCFHRAIIQTLKTQHLF